jgi:hypothetical protein
LFLALTKVETQVFNNRTKQTFYEMAKSLRYLTAKSYREKNGSIVTYSRNNFLATQYTRNAQEEKRK